MWKVLEVRKGKDIRERGGWVGLTWRSRRPLAQVMGVVWRLGLDQVGHNLLSVLSVRAGHQDVGCPRERGHTGLQGQLGLLVVGHVVLIGQVVELITMVWGWLLVSVVAGVGGGLVVVLDLGLLGGRRVVVWPGGHIQLGGGLHIPLGLQVENLLQ